MQQYFVKGKIENRFIFESDDIHHILHVMRLKNDSEVVCVYEGEKYLSKLFITKDQVEAIQINKLESNSKLPCKVTIIHALPKNDKFELALQKVTELGVYRVVPFLSKHSIIKIEEKDYDKKVARWSKIVKEASEQSERAEIPAIEKPIYLKDLANYKSKLNIVADENFARKEGRSLYDFLINNTLDEISILIGPEGGFSKDEFEYFHKIGFESVGFGKRILRSETAAIYAMSSVVLLNER